MGRRILWGSLALAPVTVAVKYAFHPGDVALFVLAALSLIPLAWLIGESTEHAAEHTGPGIGGFLNASFGNAPELIIALFAVADDLPEVVRGSLSGSVISNLLLVYGVTQIAGPDRQRIDRRSLLSQVALVGIAVLLFAVPVAVGAHGGRDSHAALAASVPVAAVLLLVYLAVVGRNLRRHRRRERDEPSPDSWSLARALVALGIATGATAWVSEILVHSLGAFGRAVGLSDFFIAVVIVAIVGNAAEHGGAIVIARSGKMKLATEIAISSSAQVGLLVVSVVALLSLLFAHPLTLAFRPVELAVMAGSVVVVGATVWDGHSRRWEGAAGVLAYAAAVGLFYAFGGT